MKVYVCGPMRNHKLYNFPAFDKAQAKLESEGWTVLNPAEADREHGFDPDDLPEDHDWSTYPKGMDPKRVIIRDIDMILRANAIYTLPGWEKSTGARAEVALADWIGLRRFGYERDILEEALDITGGDRNDAYGHPYDDFARTAATFTPLISHKLRDGQLLDANDVWRFMACVKLSRDVHSPRRDNKIDIAGYARCGQLVQERIEVL